MSLFNFLFGSQRDIKVEAFHCVEVLQNSLISDFTVFSIELKITNNSGKTIFIENPRIETPKKIQGAYEHYVPAPSGLYPFQLRYSKVHSRKFTLTNNLFDKLKSNSKVRFIVIDTSGNKYYSKKYKVSELSLTQ